MKIRTNVKAGALVPNHNQTINRGMKTVSDVKAGGKYDCRTSMNNHNQTVAHPAKGLRTKMSPNAEAGVRSVQRIQNVAHGLKVKSNVKAAGITPNHNQTVAHPAKGLRTKMSSNAGAGARSVQRIQNVARGLKVKSNVKAAGITPNHNQTVARS